MKLKLLTLFCILISSGYKTFAQDSKYNYTFEIGKLPSSVKKITYADVADLQSYYNRLYFSDSPAYMLFRDGKIIISVIDMGTKIKKLQNTLEKDKRIYEANMKKSIATVLEKSEIIEVYSVRFWVKIVHRNGDSLITFSSEYNSKDQQLYGIIEFKDHDRKRAEEILGELLKAIKIDK